MYGSIVARSLAALNAKPALAIIGLFAAACSGVMPLTTSCGKASNQRMAWDPADCQTGVAHCVLLQATGKIKVVLALSLCLPHEVGGVCE